MTDFLSLDELARVFDQAADRIDDLAKPIIADLAVLAAGTQRSDVPVLTGTTRDSIEATGPDGSPLGSSLEAEIGPTHFVGRMIVFGNSHNAPDDFVSNSADPHLPDALRRLAEAGTTAAMAGLYG